MSPKYFILELRLRLTEFSQKENVEHEFTSSSQDMNDIKTASNAFVFLPIAILLSFSSA